ncbi:sensor histidine kinase [Gemmatimonas sp.]
MTVARMWLGMALSGAAAGAQTPQPLPALDDMQIRHFTAANGFIGADVRGLVQGSDRFLYVFNARGLARFDGHAFRQVPLPGFRGSYVTGIRVDRAGRLWVRTADSELGYFERGVFHVLPPPPVPFGSWSETRDGQLWLGGVDGLIRVNVAAREPYTVFTRADGLPSLSVAGVFDLPDGEQVAVATNQLARVVKSMTDSTRIRFEPFGEQFKGATEQGHEIRSDSRGLWFSADDPKTRHTQLVQYTGGRFVHYGVLPSERALDVDSLGWTATSTAAVRLPVAVHLRVRGRNALRELDSLRLTQAFHDRRGERWYVFSDFNDSRPQLVRRRGTALELINLQARLGFNRLREIVEDHEGSLWIGTDRGLLQITPRRVFALTMRDGLAEDFTAPIYQTRNGDLWIGTYGGGLQRFANGKLARTYTVRDGLPFNQVRALHEARDGRLWVGTSLGYAIIADGRVLRSVRTPRETRSFAEGDSGDMWIGTEQSLWHDRGGPPTLDRPELWTDRGIWAMHRDRDGAIWIGSEKGLFRMHHGTVQPFDSTHGLRSGFVVSIAEEDDGTLWFGTFDHGLHRYRAGRFAAVTIEHGLHNNGVWRLLGDQYGGAWMSSDQGLFRVPWTELHAVADAVERKRTPIRRLTPTVFGEAEGMPNRESNRGSPAGWRLADGRLVFNNLEGMVVVDPRRIAQALPQSRTVVHEVWVDGAIASSSDLHVSSAVRQVAFDFAALSFVAPEQNHFRYRMDGYDHDWVDAGTSRRATYTNLPPGRFTFRVQSATGTSEWSALEGTVPLTVDPVLWQAWWFRLLLAGEFAGGLWLLYRYRVNRLLEMERLRLRIAADLHDDVGSSLSSIALLSDMLDGAAQLAPREQRQLRRIKAAAEETVGALRDIIWLVDPANNNLQDLATRLQRIASDMLAGHAWTLKVSDAATVPLNMATMRDVLLVYKEALHNVVRHAEAKAVTVQVRVRGSHLQLVVTDNGRGFDADVPSTGRGIASMRRRAGLVSGSLTIERGAHGGTELTLSLPVS